MLNIGLVMKCRDDLRSRNDQITGQLHTDDGYCCLGRFEEVVRGPDCWTPSSSEGLRPGYSIVQKDYWEGLSLTRSTRNLLGMSTTQFTTAFIKMCPAIAGGMDWEESPDCHLALLNDGRFTFAQIADILDEALNYEIYTGQPAFKDALE